MAEGPRLVRYPASPDGDETADRCQTLGGRLVLSSMYVQSSFPLRLCMHSLRVAAALRFEVRSVQSCRILLRKQVACTPRTAPPVRCSMPMLTEASAAV